jgi:hypothetical protein
VQLTQGGTDNTLWLEAMTLLSASESDPVPWVY